jgi:prolipoprotein diacylglyceryl transferase
MFQPSYFLWNADPEIFDIFGRPIVWYGLLFACAFLLSQQVMYHIYKKEGKRIEDVDTLTVYMIIAVILGARLGHVFFYEPMRYLKNPIDIIKVWEGGLASHGAAVGILTALWIYTRYSIKWSGTRLKVKKQKRENQSFLQVVDRIVIVVALSGCLIRFGNFMNSEIVGLPTHSNFGVMFMRNVTDAIQSNNPGVESVEYSKRAGEPTEEGYEPIRIELVFNPDYSHNEEQVVLYLDNTLNNILGNSTYVTNNIHEPLIHNLDYTYRSRPDGKIVATIDTFGISRHPAQLYESISNLLIFIMLYLIWRKWQINAPPGKIFGIFLVVLFGLRFIYEFMKENQVDFEQGLALNMGQWLSIPLVLTGAFLLLRPKSPSR